MVPLGDVLVDGRSTAEAAVDIADLGVLRGYGCFEAVRSYGGTPFRLGRHLDRLEHSAAAMALPLPDRSELEAWCAQVATGDCIVRIVVTAGAQLPPNGQPRVYVFAHAVAEPPQTARLATVSAPWHPAGTSTELAGVKTLSYAPNTAAMLRARRAGFDDALLLARDTTMLELPMASLGWVVDGALETPTLDLGILRSVTREAVIEVANGLGTGLVQGRFPLSRLDTADEVFVMSTTREVLPVTAVDGRTYRPGPVTATLRDGLWRLIAGETHRSGGSDRG